MAVNVCAYRAVKDLIQTGSVIVHLHLLQETVTSVS